MKDGPRNLGEICDTIVTEYDVAAEACERDVIALLDQLVARGLAETRDGPAAD